MNERIAHLLNKGAEVYSNAVGRVGKVTRVNGGDVHVRFPTGRPGEMTSGVTTFNSGDPVKLVRRIIERWEIINAPGPKASPPGQGKGRLLIAGGRK
jgi:hypothetical protein